MRKEKSSPGNLEVKRTLAGPRRDHHVYINALKKTLIVDAPGPRPIFLETCLSGGHAGCGHHASCRLCQAASGAQVRKKPSKTIPCRLVV